MVCVRLCSPCLPCLVSLRAVVRSVCSSCLCSFSLCRVFVRWRRACGPCVLASLRPPVVAVDSRVGCCSVRAVCSGFWSCVGVFGFLPVSCSSVCAVCRGSAVAPGIRVVSCCCADRGRSGRRVSSRGALSGVCSWFRAPLVVRCRVRCCCWGVVPWAALSGFGGCGLCRCLPVVCVRG